MAAGQHVINGRRGLISAVLQATDQLRETLLKAHTVHQTILFSREQVQLIGIVKIRQLQLLQ